MIFDGLNSLRRNAIMTSIVLLSFGIVLLMLPETYLMPLIEGIGAVIIIIALVMVFNFLSSNKSLIHFVFLTLAIVLAICGVAVLIYQEDVIFTLGFIFGLFLIIEGIHGTYYALVYARRSERKDWWILIPFYALFILFGLIILVNPWWHNPGTFKTVIGIIIVISAIISGLRLIWVWPLSTKE